MLPIAYPVVLLFLLPVIAIEATYLRVKLGTQWWATIKGVSIVNAVTMVLGYPLAWFLSLVAQLVLALLTFLLAKAGMERIFGDKLFWLTLVIPAWLGPTDDFRLVIVAFVVLLIPAFFLSGYVEAWMMVKRIDIGSEVTKRAVWQANLCSYLFLAISGCAALYLYSRHQ